MKSGSGQGHQAEVAPLTKRTTPIRGHGAMWTGSVKKISEKPLPAQVGPAVGLALGVTLLAELVALLVGHDHQADADTHGRENQDEDPAFKGLNHARAGAGGLGVAERPAGRGRPALHP